MDKPAPASHVLRDSAPTIPGSLQPQLLQPGAEAGISSSLTGDKTRAQSSQSFAEIIRNTQVGRTTTVLPHVALEGETLMFEARQEARYEQLKSLGSGAMGEVSLARDNDIGRKVAVKRLITHENQDQAGLLRFVEEIRTIGQLEHPNIVPIHDVGLDENGRYYFVMKYVDGETLEHVIDRLAAGDPDYHARFPIELRLEIFIGLLRALQYAHDQGIVHRGSKKPKSATERVAKMLWGELRGNSWGKHSQLCR